MNDFCALKGQTFCTHCLPQDYRSAGDLHTILLMKDYRLDAVRFYMALLHFSLPFRPPSASSLEHSNIFTKNELVNEISNPRMYSLTLVDIVLGDFGLARKLQLRLGKILFQLKR